MFQSDKLNDADVMSLAIQHTSSSDGKLRGQNKEATVFTYFIFLL